MSLSQKHWLLFVVALLDGPVRLLELLAVRTQDAVPLPHGSVRSHGPDLIVFVLQVGLAPIRKGRGRGGGSSRGRGLCGGCCGGLLFGLGLTLRLWLGLLGRRSSRGERRGLGRLCALLGSGGRRTCGRGLLGCLGRLRGGRAWLCGSGGRFSL